jgi:hypothetical protein
MQSADAAALMGVDRSRPEQLDQRTRDAECDGVRGQTDRRSWVWLAQLSMRSSERSISKL